MQSYWASVHRKRVSRRHAIAATGSIAAAAAFLAACGGEDDDAAAPSGGSGGAPASTSAPGTPAESSLLSAPADTTSEAKRGGILKASISADVQSWDPHTRGRWFGTLAALLWQRLTGVKAGNGLPSSGEIVGDLAESWEFAGDGSTVTFKLRSGSHFNNEPPVNGHEVDAEDVIATWNRWREVALTRATIDNSVNPGAPVESMSAPDSRTILMKLAFPAVSLPSLFAGTVGQGFHITPREITDYDPRRQHMGSGPFQVKEYVPSAFVHLERNPGYYHATQPYFDGIEYPIVSEYAVGLASLKASDLYLYPIRPEDVLATKNQQDKLNIYQSPLAVPTANLFFGYRPGSVFLDDRMRQAFSMTQDRNLFAEVWFNTQQFEANGLPVNVVWNSAVPADEFTGWFLDPRGEDFGSNAKYYELNIAEAKKLISAAGYPDGVEFPSTFASDSYGPEYDRQYEIQLGMAAEAGFRAVSNGVLYQSDLIPNYQSSQGDFDGIGWMLRPQSSSDPIDKFAEYNFSGSGPNFIGYDARGTGDHSGDPLVDGLINKARVEPDINERMSILHELQRHFAEKMYLLRSPSGATGFEMAWPALRNYLWFQGSRASEEVQHWWLDPAKPPLA